MNHALRILFPLFFLVLAEISFGQVIKLSDEGPFSPDAVKLSFGEPGIQQPIAVEGTRAGDIFSRFGVTFRGVGSAPQIKITDRNKSIVGFQPPRLIWTISNKPESSSSANRPLIVNFDIPVKRVGFLLIGDESRSIRATITVQDGQGKLLGIIEQGEIHISGTFVGVETTTAEGISKVSIDYGTSQLEEEIAKVILDYLGGKRTFTTFLPQLGDGRTTEIKLQTIISIANPSNMEAKGTIRLFDSEGGDLFIVVDDKTLNSIDFTIPGFSSRTLTTGGMSSPPTAGYARLDANVPIEATAVFQTIALTSGEILTEVGAGSENGKISALGTVYRTTLGDIDTGIAIVNTTSVPNNLELTLFDEPGRLVGQKNMLLAAREHLARFVSELFSQVGSTPQEFRGSLQIRSLNPVAMMVVRTRRGLAQSTLPLASTQQ